jgi:hypothetical protein
MDSSSVKWLRNWDWSKPQQITPVQQGTVQAVIFPQDKKPPLRDVPALLLWTFSLNYADQRRTVAEFVRQSPRAELVGRTQLDGHEVWHIRADHPGLAGYPTEGVFFEFFIDPSANFAIRRAIEHQGVLKLPTDDGDQEAREIVRTRTILSYKDVGNGVFVPMLIRTSASSRAVADPADDRETVTESHVENLVVNQPLSDQALDFRFPEGVLVRYDPPIDPSRRRVVLWGKDNTPAKEIEKAQDIPGLTKLLAESPSPGVPVGVPGSEPTPGGYSALWWSNIGAIVLIVGLVVVSKRKKRQETGT